MAVAVAASVATAGSALAAKPALEPMYSQDTTVFMSAPTGAGSQSMQNAQDFYVIAYPVTPTNGQAPLCNFSCPTPPGIPPIRDVVLEGAPGMGTSGTAGAFNPNWHVIALVYNPAWITASGFTPAKSVAEVDAGEAAGHFLGLFPPPNTFEFDTGIVFLCVLVSSHA